ncbi:MAG TPA: ribosome biogenesis GTP-binding protein YihA/YsxC [Gammaproteobacteria bacterium]|nr:ribosome biogenesis GTP-binding protein YihA/YsxC [Gammaproteobacteria bacterium]
MVDFSAAKFIKSAHEPAQFVPDEGVEIAFAGRSNAGKSSAINAITGRRKLARTSKAPGRTQLINFFALAPGARLVDLPGYGFARVPEALRAHWRGLMQAYFETRRSLRELMLVVDSRRGLTDFDRQMLDWVGSGGPRTLVLLTKADKLGRGAAAAVLQKTRGELAGDADVLLFSAVRGDGVAEARLRVAAACAREE